MYGFEDSFQAIGLAVAIFMLAGMIKGAIGIGLPTTAMSLMVLFFEPQVALGLVILPIVVTNGHQFFSAQHKTETMRNYWPFALISMIVIFLVSYFAVSASLDYLKLIIGISILLFCFSQFFKIKFHFVKTHDKPSQILFGALSGICGGLTSIWAPPMMIYLLSKGVKKEEFIASAGFLIFVASLPLLGGLMSSGIMNGTVFWGSLACVGGSTAGFLIGAYIRRFFNEQTFKYILLTFFTIAGTRLFVTEIDRLFF